MYGVGSPSACLQVGGQVSPRSVRLTLRDADIWALGVLLYKLCFYTTPFEEQGPLAILNVQYKMPSYPNYSADIRSLIASMLVESISQRPTAWQVHRAVCRLRGVAPTSSYVSHDARTLHLISADVHNSGR